MAQGWETPQQPLSLVNVCEGDLEKDFQNFYTKVLKSLEEGDTGKIAINILLKRVENTASMVAVGYDIKPSYPAKKKASVCQMTEGYKLQTDTPPTPNVVQLALTANSEGGK